jgi:hypothetical protein
MPLDTRIALSGQPLQVQFRDPIASYNQLAQLTSADTQNRLAQMQMQEHEQMAPYRMQEAKNKAASAQLTYDQAKQAQDFITSVMTKAAEHPEAPQDPIEAAQQMLMHPNPQVQAVGGHLLDASQKVMTYKQQAQFLKDQSGGEPAPVAAPNAITEINAPSAFATSLYPEQIANRPINFYKKGAAASSLVELPDNQITYRLNEKEVPFADYVNANIATNASAGEAAAMETMPNKLAAGVAPPVAPNVNALIPAVASALKNADALKQEIEKGDRTYGSAPGWKSKRELLVEAYKEALKPRRAGATSEFEQLLANSNLTESEKQDMRKAKLAKETAKLSDKPEAKSEFEKLLADSGLSEDQKQAARQAKITKETTLPVTQAERKSEFEKLLEDSGLSDTEKQAMRKAKLDKETAKPSDRPEAKSEFEKLLAESGLSEEQKQAARQSKITKETTAAVSQAERKSEFEKLLEDSGLSDTEKQAMRKAKLAKETSTSAAADSQFERTMTALGLSDAKKNALRAQLLAKEVRIPAAGEGKAKPPSGYRYDASGENLEVIPGGPADKVEKAKAIPPQINTAIITNDQSVRKIQDALELLEQNKDAVGLKGNLPQGILNRADPKGIATRAAVADIGSLVLHDRSGAAVTASEEPRLLPFIPVPADPYEAVKVKLQRMLKYAKEQQDALKQTYSPDNGYKSNIPAPAAAASSGSAISAADAILKKR